MSRPVQIAVMQHGRVLSRLSAVQTSEYKERRDSNHSRSHDPPSSKCLYLDSNSPFAILIYRHKACERLCAGFWHTESLNGRVRMGNAFDRSMPQTAGYSSTAFSASSCSDEFTSSPGGRSTTPPPPPTTTTTTLKDDAMDNLILCGHLMQRPLEEEGVYKLRISPSMTPSKNDHMLAFRYKDFNLRATALRTDSPEPYSIDGSMSPCIGSIPADDEHQTGHFSGDGRVSTSNALNSISQITPVTARVAQISLREQRPTDSFPRSASADDCRFPTSTPRKRKLQTEESTSPMPDSISNIHQYMPMESPMKRINHGPYPRSQPSWYETPQCAPTPVHSNQILGTGYARKLLSCEPSKAVLWNERSRSF